MPRPEFTHEEESYIHSARATPAGLLNRVRHAGYVLAASALATYGYSDGRLEIMGIAFLLMIWMWVMDVRSTLNCAPVYRSIFEKYEEAVGVKSPKPASPESVVTIPGG
jgi:hypothetical protein